MRIELLPNSCVSPRFRFNPVTHHFAGGISYSGVCLFTELPFQNRYGDTLQDIRYQKYVIVQRGSIPGRGTGREYDHGSQKHHRPHRTPYHRSPIFGPIPSFPQRMRTHRTASQLSTGVRFSQAQLALEESFRPLIIGNISNSRHRVRSLCWPVRLP